MSEQQRGPADWDADTYSRVATPQREWSAAVLDRLSLNGDETVLDAGCGSGNVTEDLLAKLPDGRVIGADGSPSMIREATERLGADPRVSFTCQNLTELVLDEPVDHVFSNATFHWIADHDELFRALAQATRPGGTLVAQCGGRGNVASEVAAMRKVNAEKPFAEKLGADFLPWNFAGPEETEIRLIQAGYGDAECWLEERIAHPEDPQGFFEASFLAPAREILEPELLNLYRDRLLAELGHPTSFNYVRLNMTAKRKNEE